jgi:hypothetical protein
MPKTLSALVPFILLCTALAQQSAKPKHVDIPKIDPRHEDVASIDGIIKAFYEVVTVPKGKMPDWGRDHTLYIPDIRFVELHERDGKITPHIVSHQQFADESSSIADEGFSEREIHRVTQRFGNIAHVWSTYESRRTPDGPIIARGVNSIELFWDGKRWWIANAIWDQESPTKPIPKEFLP